LSFGIGNYVKNLIDTCYKFFQMKKNGLHFLFIVITLFNFLDSPAQKMGDAAERSAKLTELMRINLNLTDQQLPAVRDINLKYAKKMDELKTSLLPKSEKMKQITDNDNAKDAELKNILTANQFQTYLSKKQEIKKKFKENLKQRHQAG